MQSLNAQICSGKTQWAIGLGHWCDHSWQVCAGSVKDCDLLPVCSSSKVYGMSQPLPPAAQLRWERRHSQK